MNLIDKHIIDILDNHYRHLMSLENVTGIGLGHKWINNVNTLEPCIHVLVDNKVINGKYLTKNNLIPKKYMGIKTDVINIGKIESHLISEKFRPLQGGCAIGIIKKIGTGTLGCIVTKNINDKKEFFILSNNHVIASLNETPIGSIIVQPSYEFANTIPSNIIGILSNFIPIKFSNDDENPINIVDCAIAKIISPTLISNEIINIGKVTGVANATLDMNVKKTGFMTGFTNGKVHTINAMGTITFPQTNLKALFKKQILIKIETKPGDSGCVMVNDDNKIIGLHCAGSGDAFSISNDINNVLEELNIKIYTG